MRERQIPFIDCYSVTDDGRVFSTKYGSRRELAASISRHGYRSVYLRLGGRTIGILVHRLVATTFIGQAPSPTHEVRHLDGNPANNAAENLAWGTHAENMADLSRHFAEGLRTTAGRRYLRGDDHPLRRDPSRACRGERSPAAKLTEAKVREIRARIIAGERDSALARAFGVTQQLVFRIKTRRCWKHVAEQEGPHV